MDARVAHIAHDRPPGPPIIDRCQIPVPGTKGRFEDSESAKDTSAGRWLLESSGDMGAHRNIISGVEVVDRCFAEQLVGVRRTLADYHERAVAAIEESMRAAHVANLRTMEREIAHIRAENDNFVKRLLHGGQACSTGGSVAGANRDYLGPGCTPHALLGSQTCVTHIRESTPSSVFPPTSPQCSPGSPPGSSPSSSLGRAPDSPPGNPPALPGYISQECHSSYVPGRMGLDESVASEPLQTPRTKAPPTVEPAEHFDDARTSLRKSCERRQSLSVTSDVSLVNGTEDDQEQRTVFPNVKCMREKIQMAATKSDYHVTDMYKTEGIAQYIARSPVFENMTFFVIAVNSVWIAIDADMNDSRGSLTKAPPAFQFMEHFFCLYFTTEWLLRLFAFRSKRDALKDGWFIFDGAMVSMMVIETWVFTLTIELILALRDDGSGGGHSAIQNASLFKTVKLCRILRTARLARLISALPELMILVKGMVAAGRSVALTLCLLFVIIYVFAIAFRQLTDGMSIGRRYFPSVPEAMNSLLLFATIPDVRDIMLDLGAENFFFWTLGLLFVLLASLTVLNMLIGVLVEVVSVVATVEKEQLAANMMRRKLKGLLNVADTNSSKTISQDEFEQLLLSPEFGAILRKSDVDIVGLFDLTDYIFKDSSELPFAALFKLLLQLRGSNMASVKDIVDTRKFIVKEFNTLHTKVTEVLATIAAGGDPSKVPTRRNTRLSRMTL